MSVAAVTSALSLGKMLIKRIWADPEKQAEEFRKLQELDQKGDEAELNAHVQLMLGQLEVNKAEAQHKSIFIAGWRPFIGWVGGMAMVWQFVVYPILLWVWAFASAKEWIPTGLEPPPVLDTGALFAIITAMLGIGGMRSYDKSKGTQTDSIPRKGR